MLNERLHRDVPSVYSPFGSLIPPPFDLRDQKLRKPSLTSAAQYSQGRLLGFLLGTDPVVTAAPTTPTVFGGAVVVSEFGGAVVVSEVWSCRGRRSLPEGQMPLEAQETPGPVGAAVDSVPGGSPAARQPVEGLERVRGGHGWACRGGRWGRMRSPAGRRGRSSSSSSKSRRKARARARVWEAPGTRGP